MTVCKTLHDGIASVSVNGWLHHERHFLQNVLLVLGLQSGKATHPPHRKGLIEYWFHLKQICKQKQEWTNYKSKTERLLIFNTKLTKR